MPRHFFVCSLAFVLTPFLATDTAIAGNAPSADQSVLLDGGTCDLPVEQPAAPGDALDEEPTAMCGPGCIDACYAEWSACLGTCGSDPVCRQDCRTELQDCKGSCPIFCE